MTRRFQDSGANNDSREGTPSARTLRRHHNTDGRRQIRSGKCVEQVDCMAKKLGIDNDLPRYMRPINGKWC